MKTNNTLLYLGVIVIGVCVSCGISYSMPSPKQFLDTSGFEGGLVVVAGCNDPALLVGLDHSGFLFHRSDAPSLEEQARFLHKTGANGIKVLAGKPNLRKKLNTPLDGDYFSDFFTTCEELYIPLLWHVADPEEFWDPSTLPGWAQEQGWGYDVSFPAKKTIYSEVERVLSRHRSLRVVFAHFYFAQGRPGTGPPHTESL